MFLLFWYVNIKKNILIYIQVKIFYKNTLKWNTGRTLNKYVFVHALIAMHHVYEYSWGICQGNNE